jgi:uncharacterized membrane protein YbhN (UPF0104 family)
MKKYLRPILAAVILTATIGAFAYYISNHPEVIDQLREVPPTSLVLLILLYAVWFLALVFVTRISLRIYDKSMSRQENLLFNAYSTLINFFGPGQSGPIFRGAYLKKRHNLGVKQFMFTMLLYYGFYAIISACFMFIGSRPWWQTALAMSAVAALSFVLIRWYARKKAHIKNTPGLNLVNVSLLLAATLLQMIVQVAIYAIELRDAGANASFGQVLAYTGVANFALFVALTPGAIGIREGFLLFSEGLHHLNSAIIVAANLIDRAIYLLFLGLLFIIVLTTHAKEKLRAAKPIS